MSVGDKIKSAVGSSEGASRLLGSKKKKAVAGGALLAVIVAVAAAVFLNMDRSGEYVLSLIHISMTGLQSLRSSGFRAAATGAVIKT